MLLFLTSENHQVVADWMAAECERRAVPYLRLYTQQFPQEILVTVKPSHERLEGVIQLAEREVPIGDITGVWHYLAESSRPPSGLNPVHARLVRQESDETLKGLYLALSDRRWVNPPHREQAAYKIYQLRLAAQIGLKTPRTVITNDPCEVLSFLHLCGGQTVYKPMHGLVLADATGLPSQVAYVTLLRQGDIESHLDSIQVAPCMFQEYIPKKLDLTVYVVGRYVWATAIESQGEAIEHKVDYRKNGLWTCPHTPVLLPAKIEQMCLEMTRRMGLRMCNFDLLFTSDGEYVFLEANPTDQWISVEDQIGFPLCTAIVDELLGVDTLANHPYIKERSLQFVPNTAFKNL